MDAERRSGSGAAPTPAGAPPAGRTPLWPWILGIGLALVVLVNLLFIWIAVKGADDVAPSYTEGNR